MRHTFDRHRLITVHDRRTVDILRAVPRDMPSLAAAVARLARLVERPAVRRRAVARDVAKLAASVALHGLRLAVAREVVRATAFVAHRSAIGTREAATESTSWGSAGAAADRSGVRGWAVAREMTGLAAGVAASAANAAAQAQGWAVGLNVAEALAVVALLRLGRARVPSLRAVSMALCDAD